MRRPLEQLLDGEDLDQAEAGLLLGQLTDPEVPDAQKGAVLAALRAKGETPEELRGMALAMRAAAIPFETAEHALVDTCGTGGDGSHSINISTATSLLVAALGHPVVKHGNRSVSSQSGSADVLEALGITLPTSADKAREMLDTAGWTFLFAPLFHPAMKAVVPVRRALGIRTVFNMLGPLSNPANPAFQLIGAYSEDAARKMALALSGMPGLAHAFVVHGTPGWDEATPVGPFLRFDVRPGAVREEMDYPDAYDIPPCQAADLAGADAAHNAMALLDVFRGELGPHRDAIVLNTALVLELLGWSRGEAVADARHALDDGVVFELLEKLR